MEYDPIKHSLGRIFNRNPLLRIFFYRLLDLLLLRAWHIHKALKEWNTPGKKHAQILDAGSGYGQYTYFLHRHNPGWNILALDVKEEQIGDCNNFFRKINAQNVLFKTYDLTIFKCEPTFDLALSVDVMEHIENDLLVFKNICASLKKGGMLLISTPSDRGGSDASDHSSTSFIGEHVRNGYNISEIQEKLLLAGFSKAEATYSYGTPGKISWKLSMKYPILLLSYSRLFFVLLPFYYVITYPFSFILNFIDVQTKHRTGTGLIVKAWK